MSQPFVNEIDRVAGRWRSIAVRAATTRAVGAAIAIATLLVLVDWLGRFDDAGLRWIASGLFLATLGSVVYRGWREVERLDATRLAVARKVEGIHPELGSRLASAVEFCSGDQEDPGAGSAELRRAVVLDAASRVEALDLDDAIDATPLRRARRWAMAAAALFTALTVGAPAAVSTGLARLAAPWADIEWPRVNDLRLVDEVTAVAIGQSFEVAAVDRGDRMPDDVRIEYRFETAEGELGAVEAEAMRLVGDQAVARRDEVRRAFAYRVVGGDDETMDWVRVAVVEPPRLDRFALTATPPAYSGLPVGLIDGPVRVLEGTALHAAGAADGETLNAWVEAPAGERIPLTLEGNRFATAAEGWVAALRDGPGRSLRVALESPDGLIGWTEPRPYDVVADEPPSVVWREPSRDLFVTARALVPIGVLVADDLAVASARLEVESTDLVAPDSGDETTDATPLATVELYAGAVAAPARAGLAEGDRLSLSEEWDLTPLELAPGVRLDLVVRATDYKPLTGETELPRRVFVVTDEELETRLAQKQSRLLAEVQRGLERQRSARERSAALSVDVASPNPLDRSTLDRLATLEFEQRQAAGAIDDPAGGAVRLAEQIRDELRRNRLDRPELSEQLAGVRDELKDLAESAMADSRRDLAEARRAAERGAGRPDDGGVGEPIRRAETRQAEAVERLEAVAEALTGWADYQRFAGEIAALRDKQGELAQATERLAAKAAARDPGRAAEINAEQQKAVMTQAEIGRRFAKLRQAMQKLMEASDSGDQAAADAISDALAEADEAGVAGDIREASRELAMQRLGRAAAPQQRAAEGLERMLEALRQRSGDDPAKLVERLREAQQELAELQQRTDELERQMNRGDADQADGEQLAADAQRLARALERLTAQQAAGSTQQGGESLAGASSQPGAAQEFFEQAQQEIEDRIEELQEQLTQRMLEKLAEKIDEYVDRQRGVVEATDDLVGAAREREADAALARGAETIGEAQGALEVEVRVSSEEVAGRRVFAMALDTAAAEMTRIVDRLEAARVDDATRRLERSALKRLERISEALNSTPPPEEPQDGDPPGGEGAGQPGEQPPSPIDVAELKMLRLMQLDLIDRTESYEGAVGRVQRAGESIPDDWRGAARRLTAEQRRLVELALEMAQRNNDPDAAPPQEEPE